MYSFFVALALVLNPRSLASLRASTAKAGSALRSKEIAFGNLGSSPIFSVKKRNSKSSFLALALVLNPRSLANLCTSSAVQGRGLVIIKKRVLNVLFLRGSCLRLDPRSLASLRASTAKAGSALRSKEIDFGNLGSSPIFI